MKTPKKPAARQSRIKKNIVRSPIKAKPLARSSGGYIESFETAVTDIVISIISRNKVAAYIRPHVEAWRAESGLSTSGVSQWYIDSIMPRREALEVNEAMKTSPGMPYHWDCIVTLRGSPTESPQDIGQKLAASFSSFQTPEYDQRNFIFKSDISATPPLSLNNYLLDKDCVLYLKKVYFGVPKEELMEDDEILADFFGSPVTGRLVLSGVTEEEWNKPAWGE